MIKILFPLCILFLFGSANISDLWKTKNSEYKKIESDDRKTKLKLYIVLTDGFYKNENIKIEVKHGYLKKLVYSGKLDRIDYVGENFFECEIIGNEVNTVGILALDRKISISYGILLSKIPYAVINVSISKTGFHVVFCDKLGSYN